MRNLYTWQYKLVRDGKCPVCRGEKKYLYRDHDDSEHMQPCGTCDTTGLPTEEYLRLADLYDQRICGGCGLPWVKGSTQPDNRIGPNDDNDCLGHALQHIKELEERITLLESR